MSLIRSSHIVIIPVTLFLIFIAFQPIEIHTYSRTLIDDGYYYLGYALNLAQGHGPTFDGLVQTNGVQPLWAVILTLVATIFSDTTSLLYASLIVAIILAVVSVWCMNRILGVFFPPRTQAVTLLIYIAFIANPQMILSGMETSINLAALTLALTATLYSPRSNTKRLFLIGILIGLTVMARLDNLIIVPAFPLLLLWREGLLVDLLAGRSVKAAIHQVITLLLPVIIIFAGYVLFNLAVFHRAMPVSGDVKAALETQRLAEVGGRYTVTHIIATVRFALEHYLTLANHFSSFLLATYGPFTLFLRLVIAIGSAAVLVLILLRKGHRKVVLPPLSHPGIVAAVLGVLLVFAHTWLIFFQLGRTIAVPLPWYYVPEYLTFVLGAGVVITLLRQLLVGGRRYYAGLTLIISGLMGISGIVYYHELIQVPLVRPLNALYQAAEWVNQNLPDDAIIGSFNAGVVGYFTTAHVINLDGLMNNEEILAVIEGQDTLPAYLERHQIEYIMDYAGKTWSAATSDFRSGLSVADFQPLYTRPFMDWGKSPAVYYIFKVAPQ